MEIINKKDLIEIISEKHNLTKKESDEIIDLLFGTIAAGLKEGKRIDISGFGKFEVKTRAARAGINPQTHEHITISETKVPGFKASKSLKDFVR